MVGDEQVWHGDDVGVVVSVATLPNRPEDAFYNIKVFTLDDGVWRCHYWQVTPVDRLTVETIR